MHTPGQPGTQADTYCLYRYCLQNNRNWTRKKQELKVIEKHKSIVNITNGKIQNISQYYQSGIYTYFARILHHDFQ